MRLLLLLLLGSIAMSVQAGNFFPPEYKVFPYKEGDLLVSKGGNGKFSVSKILKVDRFEVKEGASVNIQGQRFVATEGDYLLIVSAAYGEPEFISFEAARIVAQAGKWKVKIGHAPSRTPVAAKGMSLVGHTSVSESELEGYKQWKRAFERGEAGVF